MWQRAKALIWDWRGIWLTTPSVAAIILLVRFAGLLQFWELAAFDQFTRLRPLEPLDKRILIVGISEEDLDKTGQGIIPDQYYADLITKLSRYKPRAIGLDIYRDLPVEPGHEQLNKVFESTPNVFGIQKVVGKREREKVGPPPVLAEKSQVGANDLALDEDSRIRRAFLSVNDSAGNTVYSWAIQLAAAYLEKENIKPELVPNTANWWRLNKAVFVPLESYDGSYVRVDAGGYQMFLNYRGPTGSFQEVSSTDVLHDRVRGSLIRDRVVLIGDVGESSGDLYSTPYTLEPSKRMPGVEIHANIASQIMAAALDNRPLLSSWPELWECLWIFAWTGGGAILTWSMRHAGKHGAWSVARLGIFALLGLGLLGSTYGALVVYSLWLPVVPALLGLGGSAIAITAYIARSAGQIRNTFGRYLSDEIVATLLESPEGLRLGGERRKITILTSDLRGFTATSERLPPEEVVKILNLYLSDMADVITAYQGTIDEFMGDGILVLFGAPIARPDDTERAIACAVAMQLALAPVNEKITALGLAPFEMGIGINTGEVVVGNIGSEKRSKYGVVGSQVNLTYRIESYTIGGQILISESAYEIAQSILKVGDSRQVSPKGVKEPITIYDVQGIEGKYQLFLKEEEEEFVKLSTGIPLEFSTLEGKDIAEQRYQADIVQLSNREAVLCLSQPEVIPPSALSNLKLNFQKPDSPAIADDFYAKVLNRNGLAANSFYIRFTMRPPAIHETMIKLYESNKTSQI